IFTNHHRWEEAQYVAVGASGQRDYALFASFYRDVVDQFRQGFLGFRINEFNGHHRTATADVTDAWVILLHLGEVVGNDLADVPSLGSQIFFFHDFKRSNTGGNSDRVTTIGTTKTAGVDRVHHISATGHGRQRHTTGNALGQGNQVRFDA